MPADFLQLEGKRIAVFGVANRKSVAWHVAEELVAAGAEVLLVVRSPERRDSVAKLAGDLPLFVCDVEFPDQIDALVGELRQQLRPTRRDRPLDRFRRLLRGPQAVSRNQQAAVPPGIRYFLLFAWWPFRTPSRTCSTPRRRL